MRLKQTCPCCGKTITFKAMFSAWSQASKHGDKRVRCPYCTGNIQNIATYEKYAFFWALPLFGIPMIYQNNYLGYIVGIFSVLYMFVIFWGLYLKVPLICLNENNDMLSEGKHNTPRNSKIKYYLLGIIIVLFFISIVSMFYEFAITMKHHKQLGDSSSTIKK